MSLREGGQVYYVYNRVKDIEEVAGKIQKLVPEANVGIRARADVGAQAREDYV